MYILVIIVITSNAYFKANMGYLDTVNNVFRFVEQFVIGNVQIMQ